MRKRLYGKHSNGETVKFEIMGVVDSATWNEYKRDERNSYINSSKKYFDEAKEQYIKYAARERKQLAELEKVNVKFHTALAEIAECLGGKGEVAIRIGRKKIVLTVDEQYVDKDVINKKYRTTNAEEKRGLNRMKALIGLYRRKLRIEKALARTIFYKTCHAINYRLHGGFGFVTDLCHKHSKLKEKMLEARSKYQNFEKKKNKVTVQYKNYKVDAKKIHVGYLKKRGYDYLSFSNYKEYADYEKLWYEERGLTNWRMRDYRRVKPKVDVTPILLLLTFPTTTTVQNPPRRRGRPRGSKNKKKIVASA